MRHLIDKSSQRVIPSQGDLGGLFIDLLSGAAHCWDKSFCSFRRKLFFKSGGELHKNVSPVSLLPAPYLMFALR